MSNNGTQLRGGTLLGNSEAALELQQDLTTNDMQGDSIDITIHFELAEHDATAIDCLTDDAP